MSKPDRSWWRAFVVAALTCTIGGCGGCGGRPVASQAVPPGAWTHEFAGTTRALHLSPHASHPTDCADETHRSCKPAVHTFTAAGGDIELTVTTASPGDRLALGLCNQAGAHCAFTNRLVATGDKLVMGSQPATIQQLWILPADCFSAEPKATHQPVRYVVRISHQLRTPIVATD